MVPSPPLRSCDSGLIMDTGLTGKLRWFPCGSVVSFMQLVYRHVVV